MPDVPYNPRHAAPLGARRPLPGSPAPEPPALMLEDDVRAPGIAAMFRRHPERTRRIGVAAAGIAVMVLVASSVASAATETHRNGLGQIGKSTPLSSPQSTKVQRGAAARTANGAGNTRYAAVPASLVTGKRTAPATKAVISGLAGNGIPNVALNAYRVAADRMAHAMPTCGIDWALLAGIGREESDHGRFAGAHLNPDGTSTPRIIGPALNGVGTAYIPAPANGFALDGDAKYTHALGPMQFIPQTWAGYGIDANGDHKADIFNINDAALAAARYLCANGGNLRTPAGQVRAILAYNHSSEYLAQVLALSDAYRNGVPVSGIPVGNINGSLPPITDVGSYPVNPGAPTAVSGLGRGSVTGTHSGGKHGTSSGSTSGTRTGSGGTTGSGSTGAPSGAPSTGSGKSSGSTSGGGSSKSGGSSNTPAPAPSGSSGGNVPVPLPTKVPTKLPTKLPTPTGPATSPKPTCVLGLNGTCVVP